MDKHAYLIIAHHQFNLLEMLVKLLDYEKNDIYIHIDKKVQNFDFSYFQSLTKYSKVYFTERICNTWGGYSGIATELALLKKAVAGKYAYYHLLSGVDLPLKPQDVIHEFFQQNRGKEFIHYGTPAFSRNESTVSRIRYYHFLQEKVGRKEQGLAHFLERSSLFIQRKLGINRLKKTEMELWCGANWFSITHALASYILSQEKTIKKVFGCSRCADELFLQMLAFHSPFRENLYCFNTQGDYKGCMRYVDWERGNPYIFRTEDFQQLIESPYLFARKFDMQVDKEICEKIFQYILKQQQS